MQEIEERSDGNWRPSSGSIYPRALAARGRGSVQPEDDGEGGKQFTLTDEGTQHVKDHADKLSKPWKNLGISRRRVNAVRNQLDPDGRSWTADALRQ